MTTTSNADLASITARLRTEAAEVAERFQVPGVAVGVLAGGEDHYVFHGVTSLEHPLAVDASTLFQIGSTGKTFTATTIMRLVEAGRIDLDAPVRTYVPELRLKDEDVARRVTVLQLLNHTAGWNGDFFDDTGRGDDALAKYVERMAELDQVSPLGSAPSYNNAALGLAGRVIEKVTGSTYEAAVKELVLVPLGLDESFFFMNDLMTRRFAVGHVNRKDGVEVARPWKMARNSNPMGGLVCTARDQLRWARFHLGDGTSASGERVLERATLDRMQTPTVAFDGSPLGDFVGISWLLRDVDGVRMVGHGGTTHGQLSAFQMVPARDFAIAVMTNATHGGRVHDHLVRWALREYAGVERPGDPEPLPLSEAELAEYAGTYRTDNGTLTVTVDGDRLVGLSEIDPEVLARLWENRPEPEPIPFRMLDENGFIVVDGPGKGMRGRFVRDDGGAVDGVNFGGRIAKRTG